MQQTNRAHRKIGFDSHRQYGLILRGSKLYTNQLIQAYISDDSINRNFDTIRFDSIYRIESNRQKKNRIFRYIAIFEKYRDISEISRYFLIYLDIFRHILIAFQGKLRNSLRTTVRRTVK